MHVSKSWEVEKKRYGRGKIWAIKVLYEKNSKSSLLLTAWEEVTLLQWRLTRILERGPIPQQGCCTAHIQYIHTHTTSNINASTVFCETFFRRRVEDSADFDEVVHYVQLWLSNQERFGLRYDGYRHIRNVMVCVPTSLGSKPWFLTSSIML